MTREDRSTSRPAHPPGSWNFLLGVAVWSCYFYVLMEWLFFVTKPSFLSALGRRESWQVLALAPLPLLLPFLIMFLAVRVAALAGPRLDWWGRGLLRASISLLLASCSLLLIDNFTLTVLDLGIRSASGCWILGYQALFCGLVAGIAWQLGQSEQRRAGWILPAAMLLVAGSGVTLLLTGASAQSSPQVSEAGRPPGSGSPNLVLLSSDGLQASSLSVYGYGRDTTPFLREFASETMFCENAFSNASSTTGSLVSILTGKLPTQTRVIYPPDILRGTDAFQHLPFQLRSRGYRSLHVSIRHYADAFDLNMRESFDQSNLQAAGANRWWQGAAGVVGQETAYFLGQMSGRLRSRLQHVAGFRPLEDVYQEVTTPGGAKPRDQGRLAAFEEFLDGTPEPFFVQLHLMGTHGPRFTSAEPLFSKGQVQDWPWMRDFYDDAIRGFDGYVRRVVERLRQRGLLENTILVITSDHAARFRSGVRIPLMFRFPNREHAGRIRENCQLLDIAPTVASYLGLPVPQWMEGRSLISRPLDPLHPILVAVQDVGAAVKRDGLYWMDTERAGPPFFTLGRVLAVVCQGVYSLDLIGPSMSLGWVSGHTAPCDRSTLPAVSKVQQSLVQHLTANGYDTSAVQWPSRRTGDTFGDIERFVEALQERNVPRPDIERLAWETWGAQAVEIFNQESAAGKRPPPWVRMMIDWALERGRVMSVRREPHEELELSEP